MENSELNTLKYKAESYCVTAERCRQDVALKLRQWLSNSPQDDPTSNSDSVLTTIIAHLYEAGYLDDARYCRAFVHDKLTYQGWGRVKIQYMLRAKHLPSEAIDAAMAEIDEEEYNKVLTHVAEQFIRLNRKKYAANPACLYRFLAQRGFTSEEIKKITQNA